MTTVNNGNVSSGQFTVEDQLHRDHIIGPFIIGFGVLILGLTVWAFSRGIRRHRVNNYSRRKKLAASNGWTYLDTNPVVTRGTVAEGARAVAGVLSGTYEGVRFSIFDIVNERGRPQTVWLAHLPDSAPDGLKAWVAAGQPDLRKTPGHTLNTGPRLATEVGDLLQEINDKELLKPVGKLAAIINAYVAATSAPTTTP